MALSGGADGAPPANPATGVRRRRRPGRRGRRRQDHPHRHDDPRGQRRRRGACGPPATRSSGSAATSAPRPTSNDGDQPSAQITYRIPAAKWEAALDLLRGLNGLTTKVVTEHTEAVEVTSQVVDLEARIANLRASETALQGIAAKATKISDVLEVQAPADPDARRDRDADGQLKDLNDRAGYATLTVQFNVPVVAVEVAQKGWDPGAVVDEAAASMVSVLQGLATAGIWFAIVWLPILLIVGAGGRHRGRDRAAARLRPADAGWAAARRRSSARARRSRHARVAVPRAGVAVAPCPGDRPGRTLRPVRRGIRALVGAGPGAGRDRAS